MKGALVGRYRQMVEDQSANFTGLTIVNYAVEIGGLLVKHDAKSAIDFGCGRGDQYRDPYALSAAWGIESVYLYDPAFAEHDKLPEPGRRFDAVLCSDVLEHVPREEVPDFIRNLFLLADKFVWASVCCRPAKKMFPEKDLNLHVTVEQFAWWGAKFEAAKKQLDLFRPQHSVEYYLTETR